MRLILEKLHWELVYSITHFRRDMALNFRVFDGLWRFVENPGTPKGEYGMTGKRRARIPMRLMIVLRPFEKFFITTLFKNSFLFKSEAAFEAFSDG